MGLFDRILSVFYPPVCLVCRRLLAEAESGSCLCRTCDPRFQARPEEWLLPALAEVGAGFAVSVTVLVLAVQGLLLMVQRST